MMHFKHRRYIYVFIGQNNGFRNALPPFVLPLQIFPYSSSCSAPHPFHPNTNLDMHLSFDGCDEAETLFRLSHVYIS